MYVEAMPGSGETDRRPELSRRLRRSARGTVRAVMERPWLRRYVLWRGPAQAAGVALTFDDGPHPVHTPRLLNVLAERRVHATFFVVGECARRHPEIVRRIVEDGHALECHTDSHADLSRLGFRAASRECGAASRTLEAITGTRIRYLRPPWGKIGCAAAAAALRARLRIAFWSIDSLDHLGLQPDAVAARVRQAGPRPGDILLFHDDGANTVEAMPAVLDDLARRGLATVTLDGLLDGAAHGSIH